ncbi:cytochrome P450 [Paenibacillus sp. TC-CSREp1]|uniref:cytochrome P450 n=1 Tax=Paenibacillus sp. TC-CSREp1 TaxID=3410089 RepID=UPI003CEEA771
MKSLSKLKISQIDLSDIEMNGNFVTLFQQILQNHLSYDLLQVKSEHFGEMYYILNTELIGEILIQNASKLIKVPHGNKILERFIGNSVFVSNGEEHRNQRRWMSPVFQKKQLESLSDSIRDEVQQYVSSWETSQSVNVFEAMLELTIRIISRNILGDQGRAEQLELVSQTLNSLLAIFMTQRPLTEQEDEEAERLITSLDTVIFEEIRERREKPEHYDDLLNMLVQARKPDDSIEEANVEIRNNVGTLFLAGYEATATALTWTLHLLTRYPEVQLRMQEELDRVLKGKAPGIEDVTNLAYTNQIILESLRLYPPSYQIGRVVTENITLGDTVIPVNAVVMFSQYVMHRHPHFFSQPEKFIPERFSDTFLRELDKYAFFPFGIGNRICIGKGLSLNMLVMIMAAIGQRYNFASTGDCEAAPVTLTTLNNQHPIVMKITER